MSIIKFKNDQKIFTWIPFMYLSRYELSELRKLFFLDGVGVIELLIWNVWMKQYIM